MKCKICGQDLRIVKSATGKNLVCNFLPRGYWLNYYGEDLIVNEQGETVICSYSTNPYKTNKYGYVPHFKTCRDPAQFQNRLRNWQK